MIKHNPTNPNQHPIVLDRLTRPATQDGYLSDGGRPLSDADPLPFDLATGQRLETNLDGSRTSDWFGLQEEYRRRQLMQQAAEDLPHMEQQMLQNEDYRKLAQHW